MFNIPHSIIFCLIIACALPITVFSLSRQQPFDDDTSFDDIDQDLVQWNKARNQHRPIFLADQRLWKKAADFEQILKPCNQMPLSGRGHEYADCVRSRMLLMGRRK